MQGLDTPGKKPAATGDLNIQGGIFGKSSRDHPRSFPWSSSPAGLHLEAFWEGSSSMGSPSPSLHPSSCPCTSCCRIPPGTLGTAWCRFPFHFQSADSSPLSLDGFFFAPGFSLRSGEMESFRAQPGTRSCSEVTNTAAAAAANIVTAALGYSLTPLPTQIPTRVTTAGDTACSWLTCQPAPVTQRCNLMNSLLSPMSPSVPLQQHRCCFPSGCASALPWPRALHPSPLLTHPHPPLFRQLHALP